MDQTSFITSLRIFMRRQGLTGTRLGDIRVANIQKQKMVSRDVQSGIERARHGPDWPAR